jgi:L-histidine Nalpha-methyltransferase
MKSPISQTGLNARRARKPDVVEAHDPLLCIERYLEEGHRSQLERDVREGLTVSPKTLPSKYFYDAAGSQLFDAICDLPEYYPTRTEHALLEHVAGAIVGDAGADHLVELGSGASRKTRLLLDALCERQPEACYVPLDVSESMLRQSAMALRADYPRLRIHGIVGDYEHHMRHFPPARRRLVAFLGSTIGNFTPAEAVSFLRLLGGHMALADRLLVGLDLVKPVAVLEAAYNDAAGVTAAFNRNVLRVLNRELAADFDPQRFDHVAFFNREEEQIEMHLRSRDNHRVYLRAADLKVDFERGETIRTEISRKFRPETAQAMLAQGGFSLEAWYPSPDGYFALAVARLG